MVWVARLIGAFYVVTGVFALWQSVHNWRLSQAFAGLVPPSPTDRAADVVLGVGAGLVLFSGSLLFLLRSGAVAAFLLCWTVQAGYLLWAQRFRPPEDPFALQGRRQTINAFSLYSIATLFVLWLQATQVLG